MAITRAELREPTQHVADVGESSQNNSRWEMNGMITRTSSPLPKAWYATKVPSALRA